tara:strand:- start:295 stop:543 length:249 start_codon:yes stop_codon:yes gene_type:complete
MQKYKCRLCESKNVQELKWVDSNTQQISELEEKDLNIIGNWEKCKDCYLGQPSIRHYPLIIKDDQKLNAHIGRKSNYGDNKK